MIVIYNPKNGSAIRDIFQQSQYSLGVNEIAKFKPQLAQYLLNKFHFLRKIEPENLGAIKKEMIELPFKCEYCEKEYETEQKLNAHKLGKHKLSKENKEALEGIPESMPTGRVIAPKKSNEKMKILSPEEASGVGASGTTDKDGVEWTGAGLEDDTPPSMGTPETTFKG